MKHLKTTAIVLLAVICLGTAAFFIWKIADQAMEYKRGDEVYERMIEQAEDKGDSEESPDFSGPAGSAVPVKPEQSNGTAGDLPSEGEDSMPDVDFDSLGEISGNIRAWLYLPDTVINYPVAQAENNSYYLYHLADGSRNANGCLFIDCKNRDDFSDPNTIIYGHHMNSGKMFASLVKYADQSYYEEHPVFYLATEQGKYRLEIFSAYTTTYDSPAYTLKFATKKEHSDWLQEIQEKSAIHAPVAVTENDRIVTLSTCAYSFHNARFVVHGKMTRIK
jgi:sortase B